MLLLMRLMKSVKRGRVNFFSLNKRQGCFRLLNKRRLFSLVLSRRHRWGLLKYYQQMRLFNFRDVKLKVGEDDDLDAWTVRVARKLFKRGCKTIRIDANGAWPLDRAKRMLARLEEFDVASCEQPLPHESFQDLPALREASPIPLMLDESLCSMRDAERAAEAIHRRLADLCGLRQRGDA